MSGGGCSRQREKPLQGPGVRVLEEQQRAHWRGERVGDEGRVGMGVNGSWLCGQW